jgi:hypothetical protein
MPDVLRWAGIAMLLLSVVVPGFLFVASYAWTAGLAIEARAYIWLAGVGVGAFGVAASAIPFGLARLLDHGRASSSARR